MNRFKFGPEHVGRNVIHTLGGTGTITEINPDAEDEYMAMTIKGHGDTGWAFFSLEGTLGPRGEVYIILDEPEVTESDRTPASNTFKFGPQHLGKRVKYRADGVACGTIDAIDHTKPEYHQMVILWDNDMLLSYSIEGISDAPNFFSLGGDVSVFLDEQDSQPAPAPTITEIADEITVRMDAADVITFRSNTEEKLWLQCFTSYIGNTNAPEYADNAVLQYRARMPNAEPQAVRVEDAPPHIIAYSRLMEMGEVEAAKRIMFMPLSVKKRGWHIKYKYLHLWLFVAFDWQYECEIAKRANIWGELYERTTEQYIKLYPDGEE